MKMKNNKNIVIVTIAFSSLSLGLMITQPHIANAKVANNVTWVANTPNEIASLNSNGTYTVHSGDTIWAIGMHYNIKPSVIEDVNDISNPYDLQIGTTLQLQISKKNDKAVLFVRNADGKVIGKKTLTKKDKIVKDKAFGAPITAKEAQKTKVVPTAPTQKVAKEAKKQGSAAMTTNSATPSKLPSNQILYMLAYLKAYNGFKNIPSECLEVSSNSIGQGTADSTATAKIESNYVVLTFVQMPGWKPYEVKYPIAELLKEYYGTTSDKKKVNSLIKTGENNLNSLLQDSNKAAKQAVTNNNSQGNNGKVTNNSNNNTNTTEQLPSGNILAMLAYCKIYGESININPQSLYTNTDNGSYIIGQGTPDSTDLISINGNNVTINNKFYNTEATYDANTLVNEYYRTDAQKAYINKLINDANHNEVKDYKVSNSNSLSDSSSLVVNKTSIDKNNISHNKVTTNSNILATSNVTNSSSIN